MMDCHQAKTDSRVWWRDSVDREMMVRMPLSSAYARIRYIVDIVKKNTMISARWDADQS